MDEDDEDLGPVRLWPAVAALGLAAVVAATVVVVVVSSVDRTGGDGPVGRMPIAMVVAHAPDVVRAVTESATCREPVAASAEVEPRAVVVTVLGQARGEGCPAVVALRCVEVALPEPIARRALLPPPTASPAQRARARALAVDGPCVRLPRRAG